MKGNLKEKNPLKLSFSNTRTNLIVLWLRRISMEFVRSFSASESMLFRLLLNSEKILFTSSSETIYSKSSNLRDLTSC